MKKLFGSDSILIRFGTLLTSLIELNILWLLCCLPIVTAGAATTAVYYTLYRILSEEDDAVFRPFFHAFRQNFKQSTLLWIPLLVTGAVLLLDWAYLVANYPGQFHVLWITFGVIFLIFIVIATHAFAILGRFDAPIKRVVENSFLLVLMNFFRSVAVIILSIAPILVLMFLPDFVINTLPLWAFIVFGLVFFVNAKLFLQSFEHSVAKDPEKVEAAE